MPNYTELTVNNFYLGMPTLFQITNSGSTTKISMTKSYDNSTGVFTYTCNPPSSNYAGYVYMENTTLYVIV